ncbi:MAG: fasciclin domain-containing protein [Caldilinea sp. CFX5]|nr:fasciclin domain-containing protein [Caldilinea sp. CFX5]
MKRYLLLPCCVMTMLLLSACVITPLASDETPTPQTPLQPTFTPTTAVTTTAPVTATTTITIAVTPAEPVTATAPLTDTPTSAADSTAPVTATAPLTVTPVLTPTAVVTGTTATAPVAATPAPAGQGGAIAAIVAARPEFVTLNEAITAVRLTTALNGERPYTLFAPTEEAFAALPAGTLDALLASPSTLANVLQNHLLIEEVSSARLTRLGRVLTALGQTLPVTLTAAGVVQVGEATIVEPDIEATNGVIHAIDTVLLPVNLVITPTTGTPGASAATPVTATQVVTTAQIITTVAPTATIADVVRNSEELSTLETALGAAGLLQALQLPGELTLFAPTNAAFEAFPAGQLQPLLNNTAAIANVMQYHLVADTALASDLVRLGQALSTTGQPLRVTVAANGVMQVNNARVIQTDIVTANGVIHLIDAVLSPPAP